VAPDSGPAVPAATTLPKASIIAASIANLRAGRGKPASAASHVEYERVALSAALWADPEVRWLTGAHQAEGHTYIVRERYEELLWWLLMPSLLSLATGTAPTSAAAAQLSAAVSRELAAAEAAGYRVEVLAGLTQDSIRPGVSGNSAKEADETEDPETSPDRI